MDKFEDRAAAEVRAEATYPVFGRRVDVRFLGWDGRDLAEDSFAAWNALKSEDLSPAESAECSVIVMPAGGAITALPEYAVSEEDLVVPEGTVTMFVDRGDARGCILSTRAAVSETGHAFQKLYLEAAVQFLASAEDRVPLHAAGLVANGRTLLLAGPSGSGKSTLLYALMRAGAKVFAEESLCISYRESLALWGVAREIGLREEALQLFPDLKDQTATDQPSGKRKYLVEVPNSSRAYPKQTAPIDLVFLGGNMPGIQKVDTTAARIRLMDTREPGFDLAADYPDAIDALLASARCWEAGRTAAPDQMAAAVLAAVAAD